MQRRRAAVRRKWDNGERGAALVEAAIVMLPLMLILFGIIEYGFIFKDSLSISSATRAGARTASAEARTSTFYDDTVAATARAATGLTLKGGEQMWIYKADANGMPPSGNLTTCGVTNCRIYVYNAATKAWTRSGTTDWLYLSQNACLGTADSVGVYLRISHDALSGFFKNMQLQERTVMRLEPLGDDCKP